MENQTLTCPNCYNEHNIKAKMCAPCKSYIYPVKSFKILSRKFFQHFSYSILIFLILSVTNLVFNYIPSWLIFYSSYTYFFPINFLITIFQYAFIFSSIFTVLYYLINKNKLIYLRYEF